jgi:hypothetical protein
MRELLNEIKTKIENGSNWNGTIYGKDNGKRWTLLFIYLDNKFTKIAEVSKADSKEIKDQLTKELKVSKNKDVASFGEIYEKFGLDVAVGEE